MRTRSSGAAALEFAIVMPIFLAMVIGVVYFGVMLAMQQALTLAAEEGARAALRYPAGAASNNAAATLGLRVSAASAAALATLPSSIRNSISPNNVAQAIDTSCTAPASVTACVIKVTLSLPSNTVLPIVPGVPLPATFSGSAVVQIAPDT